MAQMRPPVFPGNGSEIDREEEVYNFLRDNLPDHCIVIYEPMLYDRGKRDRYPDFLLFSQHFGCVILEVKNWRKNSFKQFDSHKILWKEDRQKDWIKKKHPFRQAQEYMYLFWDHVKRNSVGDQDIVNENGKLSVVTTPMVLFLRTKESDLNELESKLLIPPEYILTEEALKNRELLSRRLQTIPFKFRKFGDKTALTKIADAVLPLVEDQLETQRIRKPELAAKISEIRRNFISKYKSDASHLDHYNLLWHTLTNAATALQERTRIEPSKPELFRRLDEIKTNLEQESFKIGFFGVTASGKSSLMNAILGEEVIRPGYGETTRVNTHIQSPSLGHTHGEALICYKSLRQISIEITEFLLTLGIFKDDIPSQGSDESTFNYIEKICAHLSNYEDQDKAEPCVQYLGSLYKGWENNEAHLGKEQKLSSDKAHEIAEKEHNAVFITKMVIFHTNKITQQGITLVDTPGLGSSVFRHTQESAKLADEVDFAIMVTRVDFMLKPPDRSFIHEALDVQRMRSRHNLIFVLNQINRINPLQEIPPRSPDQFDECVDNKLLKLSRLLVEEGIENPKIFPVDAACGFWARQTLTYPEDPRSKDQFQQYAFINKNNNPDPAINLIGSRLEKLETNLFDHLGWIKFHSSLSTKLDMLESWTRSFEKSLRTSRKSSIEGIEALENRFEEMEMEFEILQKSLNYSFNHKIPLEINRRFGSQSVCAVVCLLVEEALEMISGAMEPHQTKQSVSESFIKKDIPKKLKEYRDKYEKCYLGLKEEECQKTIPKLIRSKKTFQAWRIGGYTVKAPSVHVITGFEGMDPRIRREIIKQAAAIYISEEGLDDAKMRFMTDWELMIADSFMKDITGWVESDLKSTFTSIVSNLESTLREKRNEFEDEKTEMEAKKKERDLWLNQAKGSKNEVGVALSFFSDLRKNIDELRVV